VKRIVADPTKCIACKACELACALAHAEAEAILEAVEEPRARSRVRLRMERGTIIPQQCRHCESAPCIAACPEGAISRESPDSPVLIDAEKCVGHGRCVEACPFDAIVLLPQEKIAIKCDLCADRRSRGLDYACVEACPVGVLSCTDRGEVAYEVIPEACRGCLRCKKECPVQAISGERKQVHVIDQDACLLCGRCFQVCPFSAIRFRRAEPLKATSASRTHQAGSEQ
jgi:carbon-monoxide dehydrogenase iron sulfur subunit